MTNTGQARKKRVNVAASREAIGAAPLAAPAATPPANATAKPAEPPKAAQPQIPRNPAVALALLGVSGAAGIIGPIVSGRPGVNGPADVFGQLADALAEMRTAAKLLDLETQLAAQAMALSVLSSALLARATHLIDRPGGSLDLYMRLGLKAQAQSRATVEALAEIKNPRPMLIAKQANVANGPQQVNNPPAGITRARRKPKPADRTIQGEHE